MARIPPRDPRVRDPHPARRPPDSLLRLDIRNELIRSGQLGLIAVRVPGDPGPGGGERDPVDAAVVRDVARYLEGYLRRRLRSDDRLVGPGEDGRSYALLLGSPRDGRDLDPTDLARVRLRLRDELRQHLVQAYGRERLAVDRFLVGGTIVRYRPDEDIETVVERALGAAYGSVEDELDGAAETDARRDLLSLHRLLDAGELRAVFHPVIDLVERRVLGYEALSRVPSGRFSGPERLFEVASDHHALWRLERLCRARALDGLPTIGREQFLFLNLEPASMLDPDLLGERFVTRLAAAGLSHGQVVFEIAQRDATRDPTGIRANLERIRARGFRVALDGVGADPSPSTILTEIVPDFVKIDRSVVRNVHHDADRRLRIGSIVRFARTHRIPAIAAGVQDPDELRWLASNGVRLAQGFLLARPSTSPEEPDWSVLETPSG